MRLLSNDIEEPFLFSNLKCFNFIAIFYFNILSAFVLLTALMIIFISTDLILCQTPYTNLRIYGQKIISSYLKRIICLVSF